MHPEEKGNHGVLARMPWPLVTCVVWPCIPVLPELCMAAPIGRSIYDILGCCKQGAVLDTHDDRSIENILVGSWSFDPLSSGGT